MRINYKRLKLLPVQTKSGIKLGSIKDLMLETEGQNVLHYEVGGMIGKKYLVSREQVISIDDKKMVVEDNVELVGANGRSPSVNQSPDMGVAMRNEY